ncbi:MAG: CDP-diacylglycerol--glycerol-3-phosphate 3-phosphatidyltransferase [Eggerthellaceae bacterium]|nr:CDP-diacylglycerol--glycerol-3-phosphate 3-phosphatidyltransferase [Eggerthellaceae bacterium]
MSESSPKSNATIWTPSNVITIIRILLVPVFVAALLAPWPEWFGSNVAELNDWKSIIAAIIFIAISCTDWLDGYLARSRNEVTDFGKFMDPLADKILVAAALISLVELGSLPTWVVLVILAREFIISGVRMMAASKGVVIAASMLGKFKTVFQMIAIVLFTIKDSHMIGDFSEALSDTLWVVSWIVMIIALILTIASMLDYLVKARDVIGLGDPQGNAQSTEAVDIQSLSQRVVDTARDKGVTLATAESLTGGGIGSAITAIPGSSDVFLGGITSYANEAKRDVLGVQADTLDNFGAVSEQCALQMAEGARAQLNADIAVSVTGIAGPGGAVPGKPVGTVWMGVATPSDCTATLFTFEGDREDVRKQTVSSALEGLIAAIEQS